jgi:hypothetical protein
VAGYSKLFYIRANKSEALSETVRSITDRHSTELNFKRYEVASIPFTNKKVKGIKRHVVVDKKGFLIAVMVTVAKIHDIKSCYLLMRFFKELCSGVKLIIAAGGNRGELIECEKKVCLSDPSCVKCL